VLFFSVIAHTPLYLDAKNEECYTATIA